MLARPKTASRWPCEVAVARYGVEPADRLDAEAEGLVKQGQRPGRDDDALLRERYEGYVDYVAVGLAQLRQGFEAAEAEPGADVDVRAQTRAAVSDRFAQQALGAHVGRLDVGTAERGDLEVDALGDGAAGAMGVPALAQQRLVEVQVAVSKARHHDVAGAVGLGHAGRRRLHDDAIDEGEVARARLRQEIADEAAGHAGVAASGCRVIGLIAMFLRCTNSMRTPSGSCRSK